MSIQNKIAEIEKKALEEVRQAGSQSEIDELHGRYLGKKGELTSILRVLKDLSPEEKRDAGKAANVLRENLEREVHSKKTDIAEREISQKLKEERYDALQPKEFSNGHLHPISQAQHRVEDIFTSMGFVITDGPEVETDENNFTRLNFSEDHPAREMQDTVWMENGTLLRTHTSPVQLRAMKTLKPPFRIIAPGRVFRFEELDASHENTFHQVEGMMVGKDISTANLIHVMKSFLSEFFEREIHVRLRPGYFPFVEPGFELDINCLLCGGKGCRACKQSGWIEFLGCGLIHPNVLKAGGIDPELWNGFAFGMGLDRLVMMRYGIEDIRHFMSGNLRFLNQF